MGISRFKDEDMQTLNEGVTPKIANPATWAPGLQLPVDLWEASAPFCQRAVPEPDQFVYLRVLRYRNQSPTDVQKPYAKNRECKQRLGVVYIPTSKDSTTSLMDDV